LSFFFVLRNRGLIELNKKFLKPERIDLSWILELEALLVLGQVVVVHNLVVVVDNILVVVVSHHP
jgi:hypothetical protein